MKSKKGHRNIDERQTGLFVLIDLSVNSLHGINVGKRNRSEESDRLYFFYVPSKRHKKKNDKKFYMELRTRVQRPCRFS